MRKSLTVKVALGIAAIPLFLWATTVPITENVYLGHLLMLALIWYLLRVPKPVRVEHKQLLRRAYARPTNEVYPLAHATRGSGLNTIGAGEVTNSNRTSDVVDTGMIGDLMDKVRADS